MNTPKTDAKAAPAAKKDDSKKLTDQLAKEVSERAGKLVPKINAAFTKARTEAVKQAKAELEKKAKKEAKGGKPDAKELAKKKSELEKRIPSFSAAISDTIESSGLRTADEQAYYAIKGWSSTCSSAHMRRAAIHVPVTAVRAGKSKVIPHKKTNLLTYFPSKYSHADHLDEKKEVWAIMSYADFAKAWADAVKGAKLANWGGKKPDLAPDDPWHVELPRKAVKGGADKADVVKKTRPGRSDKEVNACVENYAEYIALTDELPKGKKLKRNAEIEKNYKSLFDKKFKAAKAKVDAERKKAKEQAEKAAKAEAKEKDKKADPKAVKAKTDEATKKLNDDLEKRAKKLVNKMNPDPSRFKLEK
ncbi:hypothetical protein [Leisingera sp.]|uniref:hypothetical protein n=1 Tax=Leisingera sp. TaxID=1879318 RepID=UPI002B273454|nr:hypothetical protein [Leisingera sp.]